ncbi:hypothetical protein FLK61_28315 [Paenalkalicoccus suaedae]|uniref:Uncharacterized protein n=1 Tax=Paenalkalicoccus suaedae TaxID=2592382 RepID=A0A859FBK5_9BACI|nr:hypothetical protein [Paenalkalicoccus suaedae]QKS70649.1 hypothetical protein FLK61_28315 [Paenalkalicoccus suaedae]
MIAAWKEKEKHEQVHLIITFAIIGVAAIIGLIVGGNEEWFASRNFSAGYMAGSLLSALVLFLIYVLISPLFIKNK